MTLTNTVMPGLDPGIQFSFDPQVPYYVYILASKRNSTLYVGVTNDLVRRVHEHRTGAVDGFTKKYNVHMLVHFESTENVESAIQRERTMKGWKRAWKLALIERDNPDWDDLYEQIAR